ncbi:hypothetical protein [Metabacillus bambusae]|uniref:Lipoprotein n=1 Tax=Metabacillus bambusae TaxID=2795218 RepID=A0ABS3N1H9_9BACI|nr:hypothetical protein [Metabacillus bambusae]MBO1511778.1 hypothetical protein [Metabacillus bambusae]
MKKKITVSLLTAALLVTAVGCSNDKEAKTEGQSTELEKQVQDLKLENSELKAENQKLKKKIELLQKSKK